MESNSEVEEVVSEATETKVEKDPVASLTEDLQRLQAEYSNYRKRVERDRSLASESATATVLIELLSILDDIDRASEHGDRKSTRLNSSHVSESRMPSSA